MTPFEAPQTIRERLLYPALRVAYLDGAASALEEYADFLDRMSSLHAYAMDDADWDEHRRMTASLRAYANARREA